jgi:hypothetical protein
MGFFDRTSYLRALLILLPFGLIGLYFGITGLIEKESDLVKYEGVISRAKVDNMYDNLVEKYSKAYQIELKGVEPIFRTYITKHIEVLEPSVNIGDKVTLWTRKNSHEIIKLEFNDKLLIPFNPTTWMDILILIIGIIFSTLSVAYLIKHPEDLWGGDKEKMKKWWMG